MTSHHPDDVLVRLSPRPFPLLPVICRCNARAVWVSPGRRPSGLGGSAAQVFTSGHESFVSLGLADGCAKGDLPEDPADHEDNRTFTS